MMGGAMMVIAMHLVQVKVGTNPISLNKAQVRLQVKGKPCFEEPHSQDRFVRH
jgi:hypothetical protein